MENTKITDNMENKELQKALEEITYLTPRLPEEAFRTISQNREEAAPYLLKAIEEAAEEPDQVPDNYELYFYAMFLLAQFGCKEAFPALLRFASLPPDTLDFLIGDTITEGLNDVLYSTYNGDRELLTGFIKNIQADEFARSAGLYVLVQLYLDQKEDKESLKAFLHELIYQCEEGGEGYLDTAVMGVILTCHFMEMMPDVRYLFENGRIDISVWGDYDSCLDAMFDYSREKPLCRRIEDTAALLRGWAMFEQPEPDRKQQEKAMKELDKELIKARRERNMPVKNVKIGRNDPCPCGSGKKYKNCCLNKPAEEIIETAEQREKCLEDYPQPAAERVPGRIYLEDYFDRESIELDQLVYLGLKRKSHFMDSREMQERNQVRARKYLWKAFQLYTDRCEREGIATPREYDSRYEIHYSAVYWLDKLADLLSRQGMDEECRQVRKYLNP